MVDFIGFPVAQKASLQGMMYYPAGDPKVSCTMLHVPGCASVRFRIENDSHLEAT